jgi:hypothetical protein
VVGFVPPCTVPVIETRGQKSSPVTSIRFLDVISRLSKEFVARSIRCIRAFVIVDSPLRCASCVVFAFPHSTIHSHSAFMRVFLEDFFVFCLLCCPNAISDKVTSGIQVNESDTQSLSHFGQGCTFDFHDRSLICRRGDSLRSKARRSGCNALPVTRRKNPALRQFMLKPDKSIIVRRWFGRRRPSPSVQGPNSSRCRR